MVLILSKIYEKYQFNITKYQSNVLYIDKEIKKSRLEILLSGWFVTSGTYISRIIHESIKKIVITNGKINVIYTFWDDINRGKLSYFDYDENEQRIIK